MREQLSSRFLHVSRRGEKMHMSHRARGEGSIYQRKDGRWVAAISLENGKRKQIYRHTKPEAVMALQLANQAKLQGTLTGTRHETVEVFLRDWLQYRIQPRVRERTYLTYHDIVTKHIFPTLGHVKLQQLTPLHVQKLYQLKLHEGYSPQTIHQLHKLLRHALNDAVQLNHLFRNVCQVVQVPRTQEAHPLTAQQARQFLAAAQGDPFEALYVLALTTGMRQGELLALARADLDLSVGKLQVRRALNRVPHKGIVMAELKSKSSRRCIQLTPLAIDALKRHRLRQEEARWTASTAWLDQDLVFCNPQGKPLHAGNLLHRSFHPLLTRAGIPRIRFHDLRHSTATLLLTLGVRVRFLQKGQEKSRIERKEGTEQQRRAGADESRI
jgi:integrase